jgi:NAD+ kinase
MRALVVAKTPKLDVLRESQPSVVDELRRRDASAFDALEAGAARQRASLDRTLHELDAAGVRAKLLTRAEFAGPEADTDFVLAVGGDGTVLDVSHRLERTPLLGVNSDPETSVGYFCACDAEGLRGVVEDLIAGRAHHVTLHRISIFVNGVRYPFPCLNDILVTNENPAAMSRYVIRAGRRAEAQASSGIWISTPAGSTGGIRSAGGTVMPLEGALIQYFVREPYAPKLGRYELLRGVRHLREGLEIRSRMTDGRVYIDGPYLEFSFALGDVLELTEGPPLRIVGMHPALRER